jgi:hypothetical protein
MDLAALRIPGARYACPDCEDWGTVVGPDGRGTVACPAPGCPAAGRVAGGASPSNEPSADA